MNLPRWLSILLLTCVSILHVHAWTDEDLELFDLVESTDRKFYDILGVDQKASASEIRKAYRRLSQQYHPDKNKEPNAEETFRKIAAIADVLRNEEQRKKYDIILQTGLPDWREPIYYYRRVRNMGLVELVIFLFCLATLGQYLFAWSAYWEKKYEIEELVLSKIKKRAKHQRKGRNAKSAEEAEAVAAEINNLPKPRCQDLFPIQLACFLIHFAQSFPLYLRHLFENLKSTWTAKKDDDEDMEETSERRVRYKGKKHVKPQFPELANLGDQEESKIPNGKSISYRNGGIHTNSTSSHSSEIDVNEFKKALKRYPNGTLQRWEKIAEYLDCPVSEVASLVKQMKSQPFAKSVPISAQGVTGSEDNMNCINAMTTTKSEFEEENHLEKNATNHTPNGTITHRTNSAGDGGCAVVSEKTWKQEEQKLLEVALLKFPKDTLARWDRIADYVKTRTKEECIARYKELAEQIKKKKRKEN